MDGRGSWLFSARKSYLDLVVDAIGTGVAPRYWDVQGKVALDTDESNRFSGLILLGESSIGFDPEEARDEGNIAFGDYASRQGTLGLAWRRLWGDRGYSLLTLSTSYEMAEDDWFRTATTDSMAQGDFSEEAMRIRNVNRLRLSAASRIELGVELEANRAEYDYVLGAHHDRLGNPVPRFQVNRGYDDERVGIFASLTWGVTSRWDLTLGGRADYTSANESAQLSPRLSSSYTLSDRLTLNAAAGLFRQRLPSFILAQNPSFQELPMPEATHLALGAEYLVDPSTRLTLEAYWKEYDHLPLEEEDPSVFVLDQGTSATSFRGYRTLVSSGRARSYGAEILLQKKLTHRFFGITSASLFRSRYRDLNRVWRARAHDNRYLFNAVIGYRPNHGWEYSARWSVAGGAPYSPFDLLASQEVNSGVIDPTRINGARYPAYHSLNLRVARRDVFRGSVLTSYVALWNAYGRENVADYYWNQVDNARPPTNSGDFCP